MNLLYEETSMDGLTPEAMSEQAIRKVLGRIRDHEFIGYYLGIGTETFALLTEAYAALSGSPVVEVRKAFRCRDPRDPCEGR